MYWKEIAEGVVYLNTFLGSIPRPFAKNKEHYVKFKRTSKKQLTTPINFKINTFV